MSISNYNARVMITIPKDLKDKIEILAKKDNRSLSNYIVTLLKEKADNIEE